ncbi:MAG: CheR family methyltransferase [Halieaceae bacterium]|jgi:chemotaxis methyl-accepting protein methylase|nr:CheR family methyltransferase [Halieaceae bacterium]
MALAEYPSIPDEELPRWESWIENTTGIALRGRKHVLEQGIYPRLLACGLSSLEEYKRLIDLGQGGGLEKAALIDQLTVKDSSFFRNEQAMNAVGEYLLRLSREVEKDDYELRLWSVGCALGQEAWSLAMVTAEYFEYTDQRWVVMGTDISPTAVIRAKMGQYTDKQMANVNEARRMRFFERRGEDWVVEPGLRERLRFGTSNLRDIENCPFRGQDVVFCQNVLIYFREDTVQRILDELVARLNPGGLLVLGAGEAPNWKSPRVERWMPGRLNAYRVC